MNAACYIIRADNKGGIRCLCKSGALVVIAPSSDCVLRFPTRELAEQACSTIDGAWVSPIWA
ncbi:MAG: hypothetical protein EBZ59_08965 [Planctomycetia bacterium]|nr:hypothetical protein [Planctomycetia bacterium]